LLLHIFLQFPSFNIQKGGTGVFFIRQRIAPVFHIGEAVCRMRMLRKGLHTRFQTGDEALVLFNLFREVFEAVIFQVKLLVLVVSLHDLQPGNVHIQIDTFDAGGSGAPRLDFCKGQRRFVHTVAGAYRVFAGHKS
jgi:hypothetical protein